MQELTFETILRLPQMELKKRLKAELKSRGYPVTDKPGYLYAEGTIPVLLVAHMDTVHRQPVEQVCYSADGAVAVSYTHLTEEWQEKAAFIGKLRELTDRLNRCRAAYEAHTPLVSDEVYDILFSDLQTLESWLGLRMKNSPTKKDNHLI